MAFLTEQLLKGKLLIALEHSGIQVIDTDGNFVSKFRWTDPGVPPGVKLFGFAEMLVFIGVLVIGYVYAWVKGALDWE